MDVLVETEMSKSEQGKACCDPIFILGVMPRSGTNFIYNLLCLHPHCHGVGIRDMPEDSLLFNANLLARYANNAASFWCRHGLRGKDQPERQQHNRELQAKLFECLGTGLVNYLEHLNEDEGRKPLVTKTPFVRNLKYFFQLFPNARLIILLRDGRAVTESNHKSFGMTHEVAMQRWTEAAREIISFDQTYRGTDRRYLIVKYEDILTDLDAAMRRVLTFLELDVDAYDFELATNLPVFGSSEDFAKLREMASVDDPGGAGWKVVKKDRQFNPKTRWSEWRPSLHDRFNWVAGDCMAQLGYELEERGDRSFLSVLRNKVLDFKWQFITGLMSKLHGLERMLYALYLVRRRSKDLRMEEQDSSYWLI